MRRFSPNSTALPVAIAASCVVSLVPISVSSAQAPSSPGATPKQPAPANPSPKAESDDKSRQLATVVVPATIQAFFVTDLYAKDSGYVSHVNHDIGDHVKIGQALAVIEDPELQAQSDRAQAAVQQAKAALEVAQRQLAGMQADLTLQQVTLKRQKEERSRRRLIAGARTIESCVNYFMSYTWPTTKARSSPTSFSTRTSNDLRWYGARPPNRRARCCASSPR